MIYHLCFCTVYVSLIIRLILGSFEFHQIPIKQTLRQSSVVCVELPVKSWSLPGSLVTNDRLATSQPPSLEQLQKYSKSRFWVGWTMDVMMILMILDMCSENVCFVSLLKSPRQRQAASGAGTMPASGSLLLIGEEFLCWRWMPGPWDWSVI